MVQILFETGCKASLARSARLLASGAGLAAALGWTMSSNPLTRHLDEAGEDYVEHCGKAAGFGLRMIGGGLACLVHAVFPFLLERAGSETVRRLNATLCKRADRPNWERHPII